MPRLVPAVCCFALLLVSPIEPMFAQTPRPALAEPWMNRSLNADERADLLVHAMTMEEKIQLVHGSGWGVLRAGDPILPGHNLGAGFTPGIPRLHLPGINFADSAVGIRMAALQSRYATLLPSVIGMAATWDPGSATLYGSVIGRELRDQGFNMSIGGGVDLIREPRNGRNFEYASEDPVLSGIMVGHLAEGVQANHVMGDIKHYAVNDQETGRNVLNALLDRRSLRETDLLAFQIAIGLAKPAGVMCSYNRLNGDYACENDYLLHQVLKQDWGFKGFVLSDWEGTHSTSKAALAGLDMEQPGDTYFGSALKLAVERGEVPQLRLDDMVHRIVRSMIASGAFDDPPVRRVVDPFQGRDDAQKIAEEGIVLLQNHGGVLPLSSMKLSSVAIIGAHADVGVLSGGGSAQVDAPNGDAVHPYFGSSPWNQPVVFPSSPMRYIREQLAPGASVTFDEGIDPASAAKTAAQAKVAIVFVQQWMTEGQDAETLSLPGNQDALVHAVAAANPNTIVVIESGGPVKMPWKGEVKGILEAWYPGIGGGQAIANLLFGCVNPSGKLPVTFAVKDEDLPHPHVTGLTAGTGNNGMDGKNNPNADKSFPVDYNVEGMMVGYKWFQSKGKAPLFPFGFGLSYTQFAYADMEAKPDGSSVSFTVKNVGARGGDEIAQVYVTLPGSAGEPFRKLVGWKRISLAPQEVKRVEIALDPLFLSVFSVAQDRFVRMPGEYLIEAGGSSSDLPLHLRVPLGGLSDVAH